MDSEICNGAIAWLNKDTKYGFDLVSDLFPAYIKFYPALFVLSVAPLFVSSWITRETVALIAVGFIAMIPLYLFAIDWGRWIHIETFMLLCLALASNAKVKIKQRGLFILICILYISLWSIPHCCSKKIGGGLLEQSYRYVIKIKEKLLNGGGYKLF